MEKWIDTTTEVVSGIIDGQKEDVLTKGATKGTINPTTTKKRIEALDNVRDALIEMMEAKQTRFLHDLPEMDFAEIGPDVQSEPAPKAKPTKKGRGKPRKAFSDFVVDQTKVTEVIDGLKALIGDKKGSDAYIILALIYKPAYNAVVEVFGNIGAESGYSRKMVKGAFLPEELEPIVKILQNPS